MRALAVPSSGTTRPGPKTFSRPRLLTATPAAGAADRYQRYWPIPAAATSSDRCGLIIVPRHQEAADRRDQNIRISKWHRQEHAQPFRVNCIFLARDKHDLGARLLHSDHARQSNAVRFAGTEIHAERGSRLLLHRAPPSDPRTQRPQGKPRTEPPRQDHGCSVHREPQPRPLAVAQILRMVTVNWLLHLPSMSGTP